MSSMKTRAATALALTLAVVGAMALPLRSAASSQDLRGTSPQSHVAASYAPPSAFPAAPQSKEMRRFAASEQTKLHHKLATIDKMDALSLHTQVLPHFIAGMTLNPAHSGVRIRNGREDEILGDDMRIFK